MKGHFPSGISRNFWYVIEHVFCARNCWNCVIAVVCVSQLLFGFYCSLWNCSARKVNGKTLFFLTMNCYYTLDLSSQLTVWRILGWCCHMACSFFEEWYLLDVWWDLTAYCYCYVVISFVTLVHHPATCVGFVGALCALLIRLCCVIIVINSFMLSVLESHQRNMTIIVL